MAYRDSPTSPFISPSFFFPTPTLELAPGFPAVPFPSCSFHKPQMYSVREVQYILGPKLLSYTLAGYTRCAEKDNT